MLNEFSVNNLFRPKLIEQQTVSAAILRSLVHRETIQYHRPDAKYEADNLESGHFTLLGYRSWVIQDMRAKHFHFQGLCPTRRAGRRWHFALCFTHSIDR